jgi:hypothetical protein
VVDRIKQQRTFKVQNSEQQKWKKQWRIDATPNSLTLAVLQPKHVTEFSHNCQSDKMAEQSNMISDKAALHMSVRVTGTRRRALDAFCGSDSSDWLA